MPFEGKDDLPKRIREQNEAVSKMTLENLESEHRSVLEKMIESPINYNELYGYYFSLVVELYSRYILEDTNGDRSNFNRAAEYRKYLQRKIED